MILITMVNGVYKPIYNLGGHHIVPSGYLTKPMENHHATNRLNHHTSSMNGPFSIAMLNYQTVYIYNTRIY